MESPTTQHQLTRAELTRQLFEALSAREKKIIKTDLFGEDYPDEDVSTEVCLMIMAKLRSSAREKIKPFKLIKHLVDHYALVDKDQIYVLDDTISETERANRIFDIINSTKSSYSIAVLYIALLDSSIEGDEGAPTHHQLACEMKRLVKEITSQFTPEEPQGNFKTESSTEILESIIDDLQDIQITDHQKHTFINRLGLPNDVAVSTNQLNQILHVWWRRKGLWCTIVDVVENLILTPKLGRYLCRLTRLPPYRHLKQFLEGLQKDWITVAMYIGFDEEELQLSNDSENLSVNLDKFLDQWLMPDCGQKTTVILQKLLSVALPVGATSSRNIKQPLLQSGVGDSIELASIIELTPSSSNSLNQNNESLFSNTGNLDVIDRDRQPDRTTSIGLPNISSLLTPTSSRYSEVTESLPLISKSSRLMTKSLDVAMTTTHQANLPSFLKPVQSPSINVIKKHSSSTTNSMTFIRESKQVFPTTGDWPKPIQQTAPSNHQLLFSAPTPPTNTTWVYTVPKTFKPTSRASPEDSPHEDNVDPQEITLPSFSTNSYNKDNVTVLSSDNVHGNDIFASSTAANAVTLCSGNNLNDIDSAPVNISDKLIAILLEGTDEDLQEFLISLDTPIELLDQPVSQLYEEYGSIPLLIAARKGLIDKLSTLIANGANANQKDKLTGDTALHVAAEVGNLELIQLLIEQHNADVDARNNHMSTPLLTACFKVRPNCVTFLLNSRADINVENDEGCTPLVIAVVAGSVDIVKILLDRLDRVPPPDINHIRKCVNPNGKEYKVSPIADAAARGYLEVLKLLQEKGANLNSTGQHQIPPDESDGYTSPLCLACLNNKVQIVKYLIDQPGFRMDLRFIASSVTEALKIGNVECATIICEKYGGLQAMMEDSVSYEELNDYLLRTYRNQLQGLPEKQRPTVERETKTNDLSTCEDSMSSDPEFKAVNSMTSIRRKKQITTPRVSFGKTHVQQLTNDFTISSTNDFTISSTNDFTISSTNDFTISPTNTPNRFDDLPDDDIVTSRQLTTNNLSDDVPLATSPDFIDNLSLTPSIASNVPCSVTSSVGATPNVGSDLTQFASKVTKRSDTGSDTDNPFAPRPKTPPSSLLPLSDAEPTITTAGLASSLGNFQASAVEIFHDFAQYLISACLRKHTQEELIMLAEATANPEIVTFFVKFFHDPGHSVEVVQEFLKGPLTFLLASRFCTKEDFLNVLRDIGRPDFPDQLMLSFHQFPNSDNIPWSGNELLNDFFQRQTYFGPDPYAAASHSRFPSLPAPTRVTQTPSFPGAGHVLGNMSSSAVHQTATPLPMTPVTIVSSAVTAVVSPVVAATTTTTPVVAATTTPVVVVTTTPPVVVTMPTATALTTTSLLTTAPVVTTIPTTIPTLSTVSTHSSHQSTVHKRKPELSEKLQEILVSSDNSDNEINAVSFTTTQNDISTKDEVASPPMRSKIPRPVNTPKLEQNRRVTETMPAAGAQPFSVKSPKVTPKARSSPKSLTMAVTKPPSSSPSVRKKTSSIGPYSSSSRMPSVTGSSSVRKKPNLTPSSSADVAVSKSLPNRTVKQSGAAGISRGGATLSTDRHHPLKQKGAQPSIHRNKLLMDSKKRILSENPVPDLSTVAHLPTSEVKIDLFQVLTSLEINVSKWQMIGRYLMISDNDLDTIGKIGTDNGDKLCQMLKLWHNQAKENATYKTLGEAMCNCQRVDLVDILHKHSRDEIIQTTTTTSATVGHSDSVSTDDDSDITISVAINKVWKNLEPILKSRQSEGASKVTISLKFD